LDVALGRTLRDYYVATANARLETSEIDLRYGTKPSLGGWKTSTNSPALKNAKAYGLALRTNPWQMKLKVLGVRE
jgi:hypothetical protein